MTRPPDNVFFDCTPLSSPITRVEACRAKRRGWEAWERGVKRSPAKAGEEGATMPPQPCRDCDLARALEAGEVETRTAAEIEEGLTRPGQEAVSPSPQSERVTAKATAGPVQHPKARAARGDFTERPAPESGPEPEPETIEDGMTVNEQIIAFVKENPGTSLSEIAEGLGKTMGGISGNFSVLLREGALQRTGARKSYRYWHPEAEIPPEAGPVLDPESPGEKAEETQAVGAGTEPLDNPPIVDSNGTGNGAGVPGQARERVGQVVKQVKRSPFRVDEMLVQDIGKAMRQQLRAHLEREGDKVGLGILDVLDSTEALEVTVREALEMDAEGGAS